MVLQQGVRMRYNNIPKQNSSAILRVGLDEIKINILALENDEIFSDELKEYGTIPSITTIEFILTEHKDIELLFSIFKSYKLESEPLQYFELNYSGIIYKYETIREIDYNYHNINDGIESPKITITFIEKYIDDCKGNDLLSK